MIDTTGIKAVTYARCGKRRFSSRKYAKQFLKKVNQFKGYELTDVYYCDSCVAWHTTSMPKNESRKLSNPTIKTQPKPVAKYLNNILIERYDSVMGAARANNVTAQTITQTINSNNKLQGLIWKFVQ